MWHNYIFYWWGHFFLLFHQKLKKQLIFFVHFKYKHVHILILPYEENKWGTLVSVAEQDGVIPGMAFEIKVKVKILKF